MTLRSLSPEVRVTLLPVNIEGHLLIVLDVHVVLPDHHPHVIHVVYGREAVLGREHVKVRDESPSTQVLETFSSSLPCLQKKELLWAQVAKYFANNNILAHSSS